MGQKILLYKGARGSGKTLTMTADAYTYWKNGWRVLANYDTSFAEPISNEEILLLDKESNVENCVLCLDELQIFFDSRSSMAKQNQKFSNFVQQIRKRNIILLCTTQFVGTVDLRLRQHIDIMAYPKFHKEYPSCEVTYVDVTSIEDNILGAVSEPKIVKIVYNPIPVFKLFRTEQMIA